jgi:proteasome lid subunit RPN8/RPN11
MAELNEQVAQVIKKHGEATYPHECCGFLFGKQSDSGRVLELALEVENSQVENRERRFLVSPEDYLRAEQHAEKSGLDLLGIYHSHPDHPAIPSEHDRKQAMPFFSYVIVSVKKGKADELRSWVLNPDFQFEEELLNR